MGRFVPTAKLRMPAHDRHRNLSADSPALDQLPPPSAGKRLVGRPAERAGPHSTAPTDGRPRPVVPRGAATPTQRGVGATPRARASEAGTPPSHEPARLPEPGPEAGTPPSHEPARLPEPGPEAGTPPSHELVTCTQHRRPRTNEASGPR